MDGHFSLLTKEKLTTRGQYSKSEQEKEHRKRDNSNMEKYHKGEPNYKTLGWAAGCI
jgi:hypothetical protein